MEAVCSGVVVWIRGFGGGRAPSFWWDAGEPMGMTVRRLPALGPQAEGGGSGPSPQMQEKVGGPACRMLPPAKQDAACGVTVTAESVKCGLAWNVKLHVKLS